MTYRRVLLKLSGEALADGKGFFSASKLKNILDSLHGLWKQGIEIGIVIGGGNLFRGARQEGLSIDRVTADHIGMLATAMNGLALKDALQQYGLPTEVFNSFPLPLASFYTPNIAIEALSTKKICIFSGGTGIPFFSTDTAAVIRALETKCDIVLKATKVNGVFDKDPIKYPDAIHYDRIHYSEVIEKKLEVLDLAACALCCENNLPILVFDLFTENSLQLAVENQKIGTLIH